MDMFRFLRRASVAAACLGALLAAGPASGEGRVPPAVDLPAKLSLEEALTIFRARGLDLLIADAAIADAEGQVQQAAAIANPSVGASAGPFFNYSPRAPCNGCAAQVTSWGVADNATI